MGSLFIQRTGKSVLRSQNQNPQKAKIRSVTLQGAESGFEATSPDDGEIGAFSQISYFNRASLGFSKRVQSPIP
ncbi:MAG: hypothetical protein KME25_32505 [Symplocastrum torsivum CPER-KK1]|jgi:hypothetical protein|uniref:Uncharacterized protein n=1 Tax=Symplocastrum torsivum CPER-KK1 TaxID=450513 RepID=A0A951UES2_9CYAN|nr:hypothetical protein [Symplocastrum torsivum CPER-KK1]